MTHTISTCHMILVIRSGSSCPARNSSHGNGAHISSFHEMLLRKNGNLHNLNEKRRMRLKKPGWGARGVIFWTMVSVVTWHHWATRRSTTVHAVVLLGHSTSLSNQLLNVAFVPLRSHNPFSLQQFTASSHIYLVRKMVLNCDSGTAVYKNLI